MIKVEIGGFPFLVKQRWDDVSFQDARALFGAALPLDIVRILTVPRLPEMQLSADVTLALYEIVSFVEEPLATKGEPLKITEWSYKQFELIRLALVAKKDNLALAYGRIAEILNSDSIEVGAKAIDAMAKFVEDWADTSLFSAKEPSPEEKAAGIEELQAFGAYGILQAVAAKYGRLPREIELESCVWVLTEYLYQVIEKKVYYRFA